MSSRRTRSVTCRSCSTNRTRHVRGICQRCRLPKITRVREVIEVVFHSNAVLCLNAETARQFADLLVDTAEELDAVESGS